MKKIISIKLPKGGKAVFAAGAESKNTFCITKSDRAYISRDIGNLNDYKTYQAYQKEIKNLLACIGVTPEVITHDMHPEYLSTKYAVALDGYLPRIEVQHHHAHIASCMAEHGLQENVIGVAFDGTGYGDDKKIWGAEFLIANYTHFKRAYHLQYVPLPGGDMAAKEPWRMAVSYLYQAFADKVPKACLRRKNSNVIVGMLKNKINSPLASSMGRLFDAVSAIIGLCDINSYEAEAAIKLENLCKNGNEKGVYPYTIENGIIDVLPMIRQILKEKNRPAYVAVKFHNTIADIALKSCLKIRRQCAIKKVVLSGGVFQNKILTKKTIALLDEAGFEVFTHKLVPPNDAGISLGQAAIAIRTSKCA